MLGSATPHLVPALRVCQCINRASWVPAGNHGGQHLQASASIANELLGLVHGALETEAV